MITVSLVALWAEVPGRDATMPLAGGRVIAGSSYYRGRMSSAKLGGIFHGVSLEEQLHLANSKNGSGLESGLLHQLAPDECARDGSKIFQYRLRLGYDQPAMRAGDGRMIEREMVFLTAPDFELAGRQFLDPCIRAAWIDNESGHSAGPRMISSR